MRHAFFLALVLVGFSSCVVHRSLTVRHDVPVETSPEGWTGESTWRLGELHLQLDLQAAGRTGVALDEYKAKLSERLQKVLLAQTQLGASDAVDTKYVLEVDVHGREAHSSGPGALFAAVTNVLIAGAGIGVGAGIGLATSNETPPNATTGIIIGSLVAGVAGSAATSFFEVSGVDGDYQVALVLRRRSDRVPVIERHVEGSWHTSHNTWTASERVNSASDAAVAKLEVDIVKTLKAMQVEVQGLPR